MCKMTSAKHRLPGIVFERIYIRAIVTWTLFCIAAIYIFRHTTAKMNIRQCFAVGFMGGLVSLALYLFYRRRDSDIMITFRKPLFPIICMAWLVMLILAILFATPIHTEEIESMFYILLIVFGVLHASIGGVGYILFPEKIALQLRTNCNLTFQQDIGVTYLASGLVLCVAGATKSGGLLVVIFLSVFCWARAGLHIRRFFLTSSDPHKTSNDEELVLPPYQEWILEAYSNCLTPLLFLSLYITAFCF